MVVPHAADGSEQRLAQGLLGEALRTLLAQVVVAHVASGAELLQIQKLRSKREEGQGE